jgi:hypothetical protein
MAMNRTHVIDHIWLTVYGSVVKSIGNPKCQICKKELKNGDKVDSVWPHGTRYNYHEKCNKEHPEYLTILTEEEHRAIHNFSISLR